MGHQVSALVDRALAEAGLTEIYEARRLGDLDAAQVDYLQRVDLLAVGALADRIRKEEVGDEVRVFSEATDALTLIGARPDLLRRVAVARIRSPRGARIAVDWNEVGIELAQVALGFGASDLVGHVQMKRGLPIAEGALGGVGKKSELVPMELLKKQELEGYIRRSGRSPVWT
jgi:2-iminoacetate synthase ThiH